MKYVCKTLKGVFKSETALVGESNMTVLLVRNALKNVISCLLHYPFPFLLHLFANLETLVTFVHSRFERKGRFCPIPWQLESHRTRELGEKKSYPGRQLYNRTAEAGLTFDPNCSPASPTTSLGGRPVREHMFHFKDKQVSRM